MLEKDMSVIILKGQLGKNTVDLVRAWVLTNRNVAYEQRVASQVEADALARLYNEHGGTVLVRRLADSDERHFPSDCDSLNDREASRLWLYKLTLITDKVPGQLFSDEVPEWVCKRLVSIARYYPALIEATRLPSTLTA